MAGFEWDSAKAKKNLEQHGIGFNDAAEALMGLALTRASPGYDENRFVSLCECGGRLIAVVWTPRDDVVRLISARSARKNERKQYDQAVSRSAAARR